MMKNKLAFVLAVVLVSRGKLILGGNGGGYRDFCKSSPEEEWKSKVLL
ncbi:MAG: hypothetical protein WAV32_07445 [Halobacteriota archaeon]